MSRDFSSWFNSQRGAHQGYEHWETPLASPVDAIESIVDALADAGHIWRVLKLDKADGQKKLVWMARCSHCLEPYELFHEPEDFDPDCNYCGAGGPSPCTP